MVSEKRPCVVFFIGTTAELIKVFNIIKNLENRRIPYKVVASGQNDIKTTDITVKAGIHVDLELSDEKDIRKNAVGLFSWFVQNSKTCADKIRNAFEDVDFKKSVMVVHGDTISTVMGARAGKKLGMTVMHVEAGLRSGFILSPFPEEIDRNIISKITDVSFCPGEWACGNLQGGRYGCDIVDTCYNTIIDALTFSERFPIEDKKVFELAEGSATYVPYAVFVFHRQENLLNRKLTKQVVETAINVSKKRRVVFILHQITEKTFREQNLLPRLEANPNIVLLRRVEYFDFMKLLASADFVITDGGSNQEELACMGKPTLILRKRTERIDGLGENVVLSRKNFDILDDFTENYEKYQRHRLMTDKSPSAIIADHISRFYQTNCIKHQ